MHFLRGAVQTYAWGSHAAIANFIGQPLPKIYPEAELWFGAHPIDPAWLQTENGEVSLLQAINDNPKKQLGDATISRFGNKLPFLVKVIFADTPLSLQVHPSIIQAKEGFNREERLSIPISSPVRNYRDCSHKPELLIALENFDVLAGFRPIDHTVKFLCALAVNDLNPFINLLSHQSDTKGLRTLFTTWLTSTQTDLDRLTSAVLDRAIQYIYSGNKEFEANVKAVVKLGKHYPGDPGVLAALLLNHISLLPGESIYLPTGTLHVYLHGVGVEIMTNSDNVLRGGLTPKYVDIPELLRISDFIPKLEDELQPKIAKYEENLIYQTPVEEFEVSVLSFNKNHIGNLIDLNCNRTGPQLLLCTQGGAVIYANGRQLEIARGLAVWLTAEENLIQLVATKPTKLFRITTGI